MVATNAQGERPVTLKTANELKEITFTSVGWINKGYAELEVDDYLDELIATLRYYEGVVDNVKNLAVDVAAQRRAVFTKELLEVLGE